MRTLAVSLLILILSASATAQASRDDGLKALAAGDYARAGEILRPLAENVDSLVGELESLRQALGNVSGDPSESGPAERR